MKKANKRTRNTIGLKVKYLPPTNYRGARVKFTQTNINQSVILPYDYKFNVYSLAEYILNSLKNVISYNTVVDNTQDRYYLFSIVTNRDESSVINKIKKQTKQGVNK
jgi:hypothetical protein|tara:strand:- start:553 stop:873 length:321 start_codon:yes stop_codon:yes gene_type:complete